MLQKILDISGVDVSGLLWWVRLLGWLAAALAGLCWGQLAGAGGLCRQGRQAIRPLLGTAIGVPVAVWLAQRLLGRPEAPLWSYAAAGGAAAVVGLVVVARAAERVSEALAGGAALTAREAHRRLTRPRPTVLKVGVAIGLPASLVLAGIDWAGGQIQTGIYGYGLAMVLGFLSAIYLARYRARRLGENPEHVTACGVLALLAGVVGARAAFILENYDAFARGHLLSALTDITAGGLIYYGGAVLAAAAVLAYLAVKRLPIRRFLDIFAPSLMVGLAFGRLGCLLNGCCFGGPAEAADPLAMRFTMYSAPLVRLGPGPEEGPAVGQTPCPVYLHQMQIQQVHPDPRLTALWRGERLLPPGDLHGPLGTDQLAGMYTSPAEARAWFQRIAGRDGRLDAAEFYAARLAGSGLLRGSESWFEAVAFAPPPSGPGRAGEPKLTFEALWAYLQARRAALIGPLGFDADADGRLDAAERREADAWLRADTRALAMAHRSRPVMPAQLLGMANALLLGGLLWLWFPLRRREGEVFAALMIAYPLTRFVLEALRGDNPHDLASWVWTHNQISSALIFLAGCVLALVLYIRSGPVASDRRPGARNPDLTDGISDVSEHTSSRIDIKVQQKE